LCYQFAAIQEILLLFNIYIHLGLLQGQGFVTVDEVERRLSWTSGRAIDALDTLLDVR
jgi:hypothetical protein